MSTPTRGRGRPRNVDRRQPPDFVAAVDALQALDRFPVRVTKGALGYPVAVGGQPVEFVRCDRRKRRDGTPETVYLCAMVDRVTRARVELVLFRQRNGVWGRIVR